MSGIWDKVVEDIKNIFQRLERLEMIERGELSAFSNDPTELEIANGTYLKTSSTVQLIPKLHDWRIDEDGELICKNCEKKETDCGDTSQSWICP